MLLSYMPRCNTARILLLDLTAINLYFLYQYLNKFLHCNSKCMYIRSTQEAGWI